MKKTFWISLMALAVVVRAAEAPQTNSPAAGTNEPPAAKVEAATIPDATHKPVFTTNTVAIAGRRVTYVAETGMLQPGRAARHVLFQWRARLVVRVAASRRARPAPRENERGRHLAAAALRPGGQ